MPTVLTAPTVPTMNILEQYDQGIEIWQNKNAWTYTKVHRFRVLMTSLHGATLGFEIKQKREKPADSHSGRQSIGSSGQSISPVISIHDNWS